MINANERHLLQQAGFTERQINTQMQKFYNLFRIAPMPQMKKEWVGLTDEEMFDCLVQADGEAKRLPFGLKWFAEAIEAKLKEKNETT